MSVEGALHLPGDVERVISKLIEEVKESCESILLTGSYATGKQKRGSDIDIFFITRGERESKHVRAVAERCKRALGKADGIRPLLDCTILTYNELMEISMKERNFYIYSCFSKAKLIHGRDLRKAVSFLPNMIPRTILWRLEGIRDAIQMLETKTMMKIACFHIYFALKEFIYIDNFLKGKECSTDIFIDKCKSFFGQHYKKIRRAAIDIQGKISKKGSKTSLRLARSDMDPIRGLSFKELIEIAERLLKYGESFIQEFYRNKKFDF